MENFFSWKIRGGVIICATACSCAVLFCLNLFVWDKEYTRNRLEEQWLVKAKVIRPYEVSKAKKVQVTDLTCSSCGIGKVVFYKTET